MTMKNRAKKKMKIQSNEDQVINSVITQPSTNTPAIQLSSPILKESIVEK